MKRYWYHCTEHSHGLLWIAERIPPPVICPAHEPKTPRLCVGATVAQCFAARLFRPWKGVYVYRTTKKLEGIKPPKNVRDRLITSERWLIPPVEMVFDYYLSEQQIKAACQNEYDRVNESRKAPSIGERFRQYRAAVEALPLWCSSGFDRRYSYSGVKRFCQ